MKLFAFDAPFRAMSRDSVYISRARRRAFAVGVLLFMVSSLFVRGLGTQGCVFWSWQDTREQAPCHLPVSAADSMRLGVSARQSRERSYGAYPVLRMRRKRLIMIFARRGSQAS